MKMFKSHRYHTRVGAFECMILKLEFNPKLSLWWSQIEISLLAMTGFDYNTIHSIPIIL